MIAARLRTGCAASAPVGGTRRAGPSIMHVHTRHTPIAALVRGVMAGTAGSLAMSAFFALTRKLAPAPPKDAFDPPEPAQRHESETQATARRVIDGLMQRGPIRHKELAGQLVHV